MKKEELILRLKKNTNKVKYLVEKSDAPDLEDVRQGEWSPLQILDHLIRSIQPINKAMRIPLPGLKILFSKAKRPSRTYDELVEAYQKVLHEGGKAVGRYIPGKKQEKKWLLDSYHKQSENLYKIILAWEEEDLDSYRLPHPLLGKLTIRELIYFTTYHTEHHFQGMKEQLDQSGA